MDDETCWELAEEPKAPPKTHPSWLARLLNGERVTVGDIWPEGLTVSVIHSPGCDSSQRKDENDGH